jgi:hypothetical protein
LLLQGLAVVGASAAVALLLATVLPTLAKYVSILLPVLLGFLAAFRWGSPTLIVAGLMAVAAGVGSQFAFERYAELARGAAVTLDSINEAPGHPEATRFVATDVGAARAFAGSFQRRTIRQFGAGPREETWVHHVAPLVAKSWTRTQAVPAWIACTTSPGFDCLRGIESGVGRTVRARADDLEHYRAAVADAERRHGIQSSVAAPVLETSGDPVAAPALYLAGVALVPAAVYGLWAAGVLCWRAWRRPRRTAGRT